MAKAAPPRAEVPTEYTADVSSIFPSEQAWEQAYEAVIRELPGLERFRGHLGDSPEMLLEWLHSLESIFQGASHLYVYASLLHNADMGDQMARGRNDQAEGLFARVMAATSFSDPEILAIGGDTLTRWGQQNEGLAVYAHFFDQLERRQQHVRSSEVEEVLGLVTDPFMTASSIHGTLADADLTFRPAQTSTGDAIEISQGTIDALLADPDREVRRTAWDHYSEAYLAFKNTMATSLSAGVKQDVFNARVRRYPSSLDASLSANNIPTDVFYTLIETFKRNLPVWHRYWRVRRKGLGYDTLYPYDIKAPLTASQPEVSYSQAVDWVVEGMSPLGSEYTDTLRRGATAERWVDIYPNQGKQGGAYSSGAPGTHPFILMSFNDDLEGMSTLAHEMGHSMHSYLTWQNQPLVYSDYSMFVAEVASNFNQAMVRAYLMRQNPDPDFQIALIEEAMSNFHRYFFIMPTLARFELEIHERVERGEALTAEGMTSLMADLFAEVYGDEVRYDRDQVGITWAQFPVHLYANFYVFQYATGIAAAHALSEEILQDKPGAADAYLSFLRAGSSVYPLEALKIAGIDMSKPEVVDTAFGVLSAMIDRLSDLLEQKERSSRE
jgi:oligoendopeptidase F